MKKFLSAISLVLIAMIVIAIPAVAAEDDVYATLDMPEGINIYYATNVTGSEPMIDGVIDEGEYGEGIKITSPFVASNLNWGSGAPKYDDSIGATEVTYPDIASESFEAYFAYDEEYIYVAIKEVGPAFIDDGDEFAINNTPYRSNYRFQFGFEPDNAQNWFQWEGFQTHIHWTTLNYFDNGSKRTSSVNATYDFVEEFIMTKYNLETPENPIAMGDLLSVNGNVNYFSAQWGTTMEYKLNKAAVAEVWNACYGTEYNELANAMWFGMTTSTYKSKGAYQYNEDGSIKTNDAGKALESYDPAVGQYFNWFGVNDIKGHSGEYDDYGVPANRVQLFDLIVFGTEEDDIVLADPFPVVEETEPEETEPEVTEPEETEPEETEPEETEPEVTEPEVTEPEETEPEVTEPEETEPEETEPEVTEPEVTEPEVTEPEVTEPEVTEPETTQPETTQPEETQPEVTEPETTKKADDDEDEDEDEDTTKKTETKDSETEAPTEKKGCGNSVSVAGLALVAALGTCTVFVAKKKED